MARPKKWPPKVHHHQTGQAFIKVSGKNYYLGRYGSPEAQKEYARLVGQLAEGNSAPVPKASGSAITVNEVFAAWLDGPGKKYSDDGRERKQFVYAFRPVLALFGTVAARSFTVDELETVQEAMVTGSWIGPKMRVEYEKRKRTMGWSARVINRQLVRIRTVWKWAERKKLVPPGSTGHLQTIGNVRANHSNVLVHDPVKPPAIEDVEKVIARCSPAPAAMMRLMWLSGMRPDEVRRLNLAELDRSQEVWLYDPNQHKNAWRGQERIVPLGKQCQEVLQPWIEEAEKAGRQIVFPGARGIEYSGTSLSHAFSRACKRAGVKPFSPKSLRHAAKRRITRAEGMDSARSLLGQKSIGTTAGYDAEVDIEQAIEVAKRHG